MAPAMKVTVSFKHEADAGLNMTLKLKLPRKWKDGPTSNIKGTFIENYNKKHPEEAFKAEETHLVNGKGQKVAEKDIVARVFTHGDNVELKRGAPPSKLLAPVAAKNSGTTTKSSHVNVTSKAAIEEAVKKSALAFDYSKWDRLDLSDEDGDDVHPNIDKASWVRLKGRQREERRQKEDQKIKKMKAKIEKYEKSTSKIKAQIEGGDDTPQLLVDLEDAQASLLKYQAKLDKFLSSRKWTADDVCEVKEDSTRVADFVADDTPKVETPEQEATSYDKYIKAHRETLDRYATIKRAEDAKDFIERNHQILSPHAEGYLLLLCLDMYMKNDLLDLSTLSDKEKENMDAAEFNIARQHMYVHYIMELAGSMKRNPREAVVPFFRKTMTGSPEHVKGFEDDLRGFIDRIKTRAKEKNSKNERSPIDLHDADDDQEENEEDYEPAPLGPGGLDPTEVLRSLPKELQEAFINQDTPKLSATLQAMSEEDAAYHMKRCIDSGLWVPGPNE